MKKSFLLLAAVLMAFSLSFAQTKKDGTPDKRYKANKTTTTTKTTHNTKSGKPDMRYKDNKKPNM